ncbi:MAG: glutamate--tRNA ligase family protein, partial [Anaerolineae bacterium]|nr:glutamate--tRNA ligase family protein [Anaerolineae bacterium]
HVPLVTMPGGKKLAKREGATSITEFRKQGYLAEALLNFLALLGWVLGEGETQGIFSREELRALLPLSGQPGPRVLFLRNWTG